MKITILDYRPPSWNQFYVGCHWTKRKAAADEAHWLVRAALPPDAKLFSRTVNITVTAYFKRSPLDADNICGKILIDGLIGHVLEDDSPKYVRSVTTISRVDKAAPRVEIEIVPVVDAIAVVEADNGA